MESKLDIYKHLASETISEVLNCAGLEDVEIEPILELGTTGLTLSVELWLLDLDYSI